MRLPAVIALLCLCFFSSPLLACEPWAAKIVAVNGMVVTDVPGESGSQRSVAVDAILCPGQRLLTGDNSRAAVYLSNNSFVRLDQNTVLILPEQQSSGSYWVRLQQGIVHLISRITRRFEVQTPYVNAGVEGTEFLVAASDEQASISVIEGVVTASEGDPATARTVNAGEKLIAHAGGASRSLIQVEKIELVDWAIYYPPLFTLQQLNQQANRLQRRLEAAAGQLSRSRPDLALQELDRGDPGEASIRVAKAAVLLSVGQVAAAEKVLDNLQSAPALAVRSIIHSASNRAQQALDTARRAVALDTGAAAAHVALSYAQQTNLDLHAALEAALQAVELQARSSLTWSRVSELQLALGNISEASRSAQRALKLDTDDPRALTQLAFINLFSLKFGLAEAQFQQAIQKDSENPGAHLGYGLTLLRQGDVQAGRTQLEIANSLDPGRSVLRSYLGRAYFEEKRDAEAQVQWQLAREFDPEDPTPRFYEGVRRLFANDPVGAIEELEVSRDLNDQRALYRSETLLQSDAASRSAALAASFNQVDYERGVLMSAWEGMRKDPGNSGSHRLLADYYRSDSRFESARASEVLQAQLWQPLSTYPLQPQLSETDIAFVEGFGPQRPGLNEYHSLFAQNGLYGSVSGYAGGDDTWGDDLSATYLGGPVALSLAQYHFESAGWRENSAQEQDIYDGLIQWQLSSATSMQLGVRKLEWDQENIAPEFSTLTTNLLSRDLNRTSSRIGLRHEFTADFSGILSLSRQEQELRFSDLSALSGEDLEASSAEIQFVSHNPGSRQVFGLGYTTSESEGDRSEELLIPFLDLFFVRDELKNSDPSLLNAYLYSNAQLKKSLNISWGLSFDRYKRRYRYDQIDQFCAIASDTLTPGEPCFLSNPDQQPVVFSDSKRRWSPKVGLEYQVSDKLALRLAWFSSVNRILTSDQTIEPTLFAGFEQLYDEPEFAEAETTGFAVDYAVAQGMRMGGSLVQRDVEVETPLDTGGFSLVEYDNFLATVFFNYTPVSRVSLSTRLEYDKFEFEDTVAEFDVALPHEILRYSLPIDVSVFFDHGLSLKVEGRYYRQRLQLVKYADNAANVTLPESRSDWVGNIAVTYRLPSRIGQVVAGVNNVFDESREYVNFNGTALEFYPSRIVYARVTLNF